MDFFSFTVLGFSWSFPSNESHVFYFWEISWVDDFVLSSPFSLWNSFLMIMSLLNWCTNPLSFLVNFYPLSCPHNFFYFLEDFLKFIFLFIHQSFHIVFNFQDNFWMFLWSQSTGLFSHRYNYLLLFLWKHCFVLLCQFLVLMHCFSLPKFDFSLLLIFCFVFYFYVEAFFKYQVILPWSFRVRSESLKSIGNSLSGCGLFPSWAVGSWRTPTTNS